MKIKKPSLKGMSNCEYLGRFSKDEYIQQGHNFSGKIVVEGPFRFGYGEEEKVSPEPQRSKPFSDAMDAYEEAKSKRAMKKLKKALEGAKE